MTLGERIKELREQQGMSLAELARRSGLSKGGLWKIENDECDASVKSVATICRALNLPLVSIFAAISVDATDEAKPLPFTEA